MVKKMKKKPTKKKLPRELTVSKHQTGKTKDIKQDKRLKAMKPGKRISKSKKIYYEHRRNRSDKDKRKRL